MVCIPRADIQFYLAVGVVVFGLLDWLFNHLKEVATDSDSELKSSTIVKALSLAAWTLGAYELIVLAVRVC